MKELRCLLDCPGLRVSSDDEAIALFADLASACQWLQRSPPSVTGRRRPRWDTRSDDLDQGSDAPGAPGQT